MSTAMPIPSTARKILRIVFCVAAICAVVYGRPGWGDEGCHASNRGLERMESARISLLNDQSQRVEFESFIADDPTERAAGYQHICPRVIARTTILFRYPAPLSGRFHMRNVKAPLDIGFFDGAGVLMQAMMMHPYGDGEEILYGPMQQFQYALEARPGFFKEKGLSAGSSRLLVEALP